MALGGGRWCTPLLVWEVVLSIEGGGPGVSIGGKVFCCMVEASDCTPGDILTRVERSLGGEIMKLDPSAMALTEGRSVGCDEEVPLV